MRPESQATSIAIIITSFLLKYATVWSLNLNGTSTLVRFFQMYYTEENSSSKATFSRKLI